MSRKDVDPYIVLGVRRQASPEEIARAYRRAARLTHPDSGGAGAGSEPFRLVNDAYALLRDPGRRAGYDRLHSFQRQEVAPVANGSVRYAAGGQHVVLGSRRPPAAGVRGIVDMGGLGAVPGAGDIEQLLAVVGSLLRS